MSKGYGTPSLYNISSLARTTYGIRIVLRLLLMPEYKQLYNKKQMFIPAGNAPGIRLAWIFGDCRGGQIPGSLLCCRFDTSSACCGGFDFVYFQMHNFL